MSVIQGYYTSLGQHGIATSWANGTFCPIISTLWHPMGCYQTAVFSKFDPNYIIGYQVSRNPEDAIIIHIKTIKMLLMTPDFKLIDDNWTTPLQETKITIIESIKPNSSDLSIVFNGEYLNECLVLNELPPLVLRDSAIRSNKIFTIFIWLPLLIILILIIFITSKN